MTKNKEKKSSWEEIDVGEFFQYIAPKNTTNHEQEETEEINYYLYQKIKPIGNFNAILLNSGTPCNLHEKSPLFKKIRISFEISEIED